tara:strand:+ start:2589 stop:2885 length:297 start_codon:yes stop_codon:yes gene_type:complete
MRQITREAIWAFRYGKTFKKGNTSVEISEGGTHTLKLHGNTIAQYSNRGELWVTTSGWNTPTTKERLNGIHGVDIIQKNFEWFLNGKPWDGLPIRVEY